MTWRVFYAEQFTSKIRKLRTKGTAAEVAAVSDVVRATIRAPADHDGEQPGIGIPGSVRRIVPGHGFRLIYAYDEALATIDILDLHTVMNSGSTPL